MNPTPEQKRFAEVISDLMSSLTLTVKDFSERVGVNRGTVNNWVGKGHKWVDIEKITIANLEAIARLKGCTVDELMQIIRGSRNTIDGSLTTEEIRHRLKHYLSEAQRLVRHLEHAENPDEDSEIDYSKIDLMALRDMTAHYLNEAGYELDTIEGFKFIADAAGAHVLPLKRVQQIMTGQQPLNGSDLIHLARVFHALRQPNESDQNREFDVQQLYRLICQRDDESDQENEQISNGIH